MFGYGVPGKKAPAPWAHCLIPPFPERAETSAQKPLICGYNALCGRADVWSARKVVFGYGLPPENGIGSQWRHCCCRGREVGTPRTVAYRRPGKICLYPLFPP